MARGAKPTFRRRTTPSQTPGAPQKWTCLAGSADRELDRRFGDALANGNGAEQPLPRFDAALPIELAVQKCS